MTEVAHDTRVIEPDAESYNATLVRREVLTDELAYFWVKFDGPATPFEPGQYMTTGVVTEGRMLQRPYSVASGPSTADTEGYEFFVRHVPIVRFTTALWRLPVGHQHGPLRLGDCRSHVCHVVCLVHPLPLKDFIPCRIEPGQ